MSGPNVTWEQRRAEGDRIIAEARAELEAKYGADILPAKARELVWRKAWEDGHASGLGEVRYHYDDLIDIAFAARGDA